LEVKKSLTYKDAGVNIETTNMLVKRIKSIAKTSFRPEVLTDVGGFSGLFLLDTQKYKKPVLTASTDGVGTKLKIAFMTNIHDTIGIDLVAMSVNDILAQGAEPLFLLDYISTGAVEPKTVEAVISGISRGCKEAGCSLIGGEIAEMPSFYKEGEYDLAGFVVGVVDQDKIIDGLTIKIGDKVLGIASSGLHSNGYSLVRKIVFEKLNLDLNKKIEELGRNLGEELLEPTIIYVKPVLKIIAEFNVHGISHITGGGLTENIPRILPDDCQAVINKDSWEIPPIFTFIQGKGNISEAEMLKTFNNGIGMVLIVPQEEANDIISRLQGMQLKSYVIGEIVKRKEEEGAVIFI
jgi:phosphoribosylformylglycinamidine cyclo-ligase